MGIIGSPLPGEVQSALHTVGDSPPADGWDNRIAGKETVVANVRFNYQKNIFTLKGLRFLSIRQMQLASFFEVNSGLYLNALSLGGRFSVFNGKTIGNATNTYRLSPYQKNEPKKRVRLTIYFIPQYQFIVQSTALQGLPWLDSPYVITEDVLERNIWMMEVGMNLRFNRFQLSYLVKARSKEFSKYPNQWHTWAGVTMGYTF